MRREVRTHTRHIRTPGRAAARLEAGHVGRVVVDALDGDVGGAELGRQRGDERGADDPADVAALEGAAREDEGEGRAEPVEDVVARLPRQGRVRAAEDC